MYPNSFSFLKNISKMISVAFHGKKKERQTDRQKNTDSRQTNRETIRQMDRHTDCHTERKTEQSKKVVTPRRFLDPVQCSRLLAQCSRLLAQLLSTRRRGGGGVRMGSLDLEKVCGLLHMRKSVVFF